jgi:hypothetical protein
MKIINIYLILQSENPERRVESFIEQKILVLHFFSICCTAEKISRTDRVRLHANEKKVFSPIFPLDCYSALTHKRRPIMKNRIRSRNPFQWLALLTLACVIGIGLTGCHERGRASMERINTIMDKFSRELNLDDSQKMQLDAIKEEIRKTRSQLADRRNERFNELLVQVRSEQMDGKWMKQQVINYTETVLQNSDRFIELIAAFQQSLHPEQKETLAALMQKHRERMKFD